MKNSFVKFFLILIVTALFGCQSLRQSEPEEISKVPPIPPAESDFKSGDLDKTTKTTKVQVALFLPFSGSYKDLGWSIFNTAAISLFENDINNNIELVLIDSKEPTDGTSAAFNEIVSRNIKVVIGPVFSASAEAIAKDAKQHGIAVISLSNNQDLINKIDARGGIFVAGMIPETQIDKLVGYSLSNNKNYFASISPSNQYGITITDLFKRMVRDRDGTFITSEFYKNTSGKEINRAVDRVLSSFAISKKLAQEKKLKKDLVINDWDRIHPQVIFIPESGKVLSKIVAEIKKQNKEERKYQIVGTNQWDDISTLNDMNLVGGWFVGSENEKFRSLEKTYYQLHNEFPPRIASIAYDAITVVATLASKKDGEAPTVTDFVGYKNPPKNGFEGVDGLFRFLSNGLVQRNLSVLQVGNGRFEVVEGPVGQFLNY